MLVSIRQRIHGGDDRVQGFTSQQAHYLESSRLLLLLGTSKFYSMHFSVTCVCAKPKIKLDEGQIGAGDEG